MASAMRRSKAGSIGWPTMPSIPHMHGPRSRPVLLSPKRQRGGERRRRDALAGASGSSTLLARNGHHGQAEEAAAEDVGEPGQRHHEAVVEEELVVDRGCVERLRLEQAVVDPPAESADGVDVK